MQILKEHIFQGPARASMKVNFQVSYRLTLQIIIDPYAVNTYNMI